MPKSYRARSCGQLPEPDHHGGDADHRQEGLSGFVVARRDAAEVFDFVDKAFDEMAFLVEVGIVGGSLSAGAVRRDHSDHAAGVEVRSQGIGVEGRVGDQDLDGQPADERFGLRHLVHLTRGEVYVKRLYEVYSAIL